MTDFIFPPEGKKAEYKATFPNRRELARNIAAFANTEGGQIFIGAMPDQTGNIVLKGLPAAVVDAVHEEILFAQRMISPQPSVSVYIKNIDGKQIVIIDVHKGNAPFLVDDGRYYSRRGAATELTGQDLLAALSQAVPPLRSNILKELEVVEPRTEKSLKALYPDLADKWHFAKVVQETIEEKPYLNFNQLLSESIKHTRDDLTTRRRERFQQARIAFIVALITLALALILVSVGVILIFTTNIQIGVVSSVVSIVSGIFSGMSFTFYKQTNDRMDEDAKELVALEKSYTAMQYISYITDVKVKDEAIRELAKSISLRDQASK